MKYKTINSDKSNTPYSDAIEIGDIIEFSGMIGNTENGLVEGGFESELNQIFKNLNIIDLTGAGDMFLAAYIFAKISNKPVADRIKFANKCSGNVIQRYGAKLDTLDYSKLLKELQ